MNLGTLNVPRTLEPILPKQEAVSDRKFRYRPAWRSTLFGKDSAGRTTKFNTTSSRPPVLKRHPNHRKGTGRASPTAVKEADLKRSLFDGERCTNAGTSLVKALDYGWACKLNGAVTRGVDAAESEH